MAGQDAVGRLFDIGTGWVPVDAQSAQTGKRLAMSVGQAVTFVVFKAAGTAGDDHSYTLKQHTAYTGGTTADLDAIDEYFVKQETALDNDESWERFTQTADAAITDAGAAGTSAEQQQIIAFTVRGSQLTEGYSHVSLDSGGEGSNAQLSACLYFVHELRYQRKPTKLRNLLRPSAADA